MWTARPDRPLPYNMVGHARYVKRPRKALRDDLYLFTKFDFYDINSQCTP